MRARLALLPLVCVSAFGVLAFAKPDGGAPKNAPRAKDAGAASAKDGGAIAIAPAGSNAPIATDASAPIVSCIENLPPGTEKPILNEIFPTRGLSGYASTLEVTVFHGKGESVLPNGLAIRSESEAGQALKKAGFVFPHQDGSAAAHVDPQPDDPTRPSRAVTKLSVPLVALPADPGRHVLTLPPLPVAVARKNGDLATVCTQPHVITIEDPIANTPDPQPAQNPLLSPQREEWTALEKALQYIGIGLAAGLLTMWIVRWWRGRPKALPPPPPPRPAWEVAFEKLEAVKRSDLLEEEKFGDYFDRVSDAVRAYLGERYGFDGLESTSDEILNAVKKRVSGHGYAEILAFLQECDLVKFANIQPNEKECVKILEFGVSIVRTTMPTRELRSRAPEPIARGGAS